MKRGIAILLLLVLCIGLFPFSAKAAEAKIGAGSYSEKLKTFIMAGTNENSKDKPNIKGVLEWKPTNETFKYYDIAGTLDIRNVYEGLYVFHQAKCIDHSSNTCVLKDKSVLWINNVDWTNEDESLQNAIEESKDNFVDAIFKNGSNVYTPGVNSAIDYLRIAFPNLNSEPDFYADMLEFYNENYLKDTRVSAAIEEIRTILGAVDEEQEAEEVETDKGVWLNSLGEPKDPTKEKDWFVAALWEHQGLEVPDSFKPNTSGIRAYQNSTTIGEEAKLKISAVYWLPNAKADIATKPFLDAMTWNAGSTTGIGLSKEVAEQALADYNAMVPTLSDSIDMSKRIATFPSRIKYLTNMVMINEPVDSGMHEYIHSQDTGSFFYPYIYKVNSTNITRCVNSKAYLDLVATCMEMSYYSERLVDRISTQLASSNKSWSTMSGSLTQLLAIKEAVDYISSTQMSDAWARTIIMAEDTNVFNSLEKLYNELKAQNAFEGLTSYNVADVGKPFAAFFELASAKLSSSMLEGVALSSMYLPMQTNMYDPMTIKMSEDEEFIQDFNYKYGFHRKALYIDTNADAALDFSRTQRMGATRVATLEDLMFADKDVVLYLDDNMYNVKELADLQGMTLNRLDNVDAESTSQNWFGSLMDRMKETFTMDIFEMSKTSEKSRYSSKLSGKNLLGEDNIAPFSTTEAVEDAPKNNYNEYLMCSADIIEYLGEKEYSIMQTFAVLSGVYRDKELLAFIDTHLNSSHPVFMSSPTLPMSTDASTEERNTIFNYLLLKNLEVNTPIGYATHMDMTSPIYMDVYGNILTESGVVVIPAAANATLHNAGYTPYTAALLSTYGDAYKLPESTENVSKQMNKMFEVVDGYWEIKTIETFDNQLDTSALSTANIETLKQLKQLYSYDLNTGMFKFNMAVNDSIEVMRGAPIEKIDKDFEGLNTARRLDRNGLIAASKLEDLGKSLGSKDINTTLALPNLAFIDGLEYIILFAFKILMLFIIIVWMGVIYLDAVGGTFSIKTIGKMLGILGLVLSLIIIVPASFDLTYYQSNKLLLQKETSYLQMLNLEKQESGVEIGVSEITAPDMSTTLYLKLDEIQMHWYDMFEQILVSSTFDTMENVYKEYNESSFISGKDNIETMNDGVYISTANLFASSSIDFNPDSRNIWQFANQGTEASFYTPYYAFLDSLVSRVNQYNMSNNMYAYSTKIQKGGKVKTVGLIKAYFESEFFMNELTDVLGLYSIYDVQQGVEEGKVYTETETVKMQASQWCNTQIDEEQTLKRITKLLEYSREYISDNKELIGKVTDETFLKCMALDLAIQHNKIFNTQRADALEIYKLSNDDLMRMSIASKEQVMKSSPFSFARFVYEVGGTVSVYAAAILSIITFVSSWVKPLVTIAVFILVFLSIFIHKIILRKKNKSYYGYVCTIALICAMNIVYSLLLKLSLLLPSYGLPATVCIILQIIVQVLYMMALLWVITVAAKDWKNLGYSKHSDTFNRLTTRGQSYQYQNSGQRHRDGWEYYNDLVKKQEQRKQNYSGTQMFQAEPRHHEQEDESRWRLRHRR